VYNSYYSPSFDRLHILDRVLLYVILVLTIKKRQYIVLPVYFLEIREQSKQIKQAIIYLNYSLLSLITF